MFGEEFTRMQQLQDRAEDNVRYWDGKRREQLGFVNNAVLGLSVAGMVLVVQALSSEAIARSTSASLLAVASVACVGASTVVGILVAMNRLYDFREEAAIAREEADAYQGSPSLQPRRDALTALGRRTWELLYLQIGAAIVGILAVLFSLVIVSARAI